MDSDHRDSDAVPPDLAMKARMAQHALHHPEGFDLRTAIVLSENKLLPETLDTFAPEAEILAAIRDPGDANRIAAPPGPLVAVKDPAGGTNASVVTAAEFLLSEVLEARRASVRHLESLAAAWPPILTDRSRATLEKSKDALLSADTWRPAAVAVLDALDDDFLYNLAGLHQCVAIDYREGATNYAPLVLRPSLTSINAIPFPVGTPTQEREGLIGWTDETVRSAASVAALCDSYYTKLGHVPLTGDLSLGAVFRKWASVRSENSLTWAAVWAWADAAGGPLPRYHACQVFVDNPSAVPENEKANFWKEILDVAILPDRGGEWGKWARPWLLRCELLRHYTAHLECLAPGEDGERIACAAMWVTERVASALSVPSVDIARLLDQTIVPTGDQARGVWQITRPPERPCSLRYAALFSTSLWSLSLLGELGGRIREYESQTDDARADERVKETLMIWLMQSFPPLPVAEPPIYAFDRTVVAAADAWVQPSGDGEENLVGAIRSLAECQRVFADPERLESEIRGLPRGNEASQYVLAQAMRSMAYTSRLPVELMRECLWSDEWRLGILQSMSPASLTTFWDGIIELQLQQGGEWLSQLPHLWVRMCEGLDEEDEKYGELVDLVILGSVNCGAASALKRLLASPNRTIMEKTAVWRQRFEVAIQTATPWSQAKVRGFLSVLSLPGLATVDTE
jgi:hypothetical protein